MIAGTLTYAQYEALRTLLSNGYGDPGYAPLTGDDLEAAGIRHSLPALKRLGVVRENASGIQVITTEAYKVIESCDIRWADRYMGGG